MKKKINFKFENREHYDCRNMININIEKWNNIYF